MIAWFYQDTSSNKYNLLYKNLAFKYVLTLVCHSGNCHYHDWHSNSRGENPDAHIDYFGLDGGTKFQCSHRVAHSNITVHTHHSKGEDTGEHVIVVNSYDNFT